MPRPDRSNAIDHVVVIMFENRSFDNLLGRLYEPGEVASFAGVTGLGLSNPVPEWAADAAPGTAPKLVPYGTAAGMNVPSPDSGEEYQHVNTQLFGLIDPPSNRAMVAEHMVAPYNAPADPAQRPTMDGFVTDAYNTLLMITFDEHGGTYDHIPPPPTVPPDPAAPAQQMGFTFERSGLRVPAIAVPGHRTIGQVHAITGVTVPTAEFTVLAALLADLEQVAAICAHYVTTSVATFEEIPPTAASVALHRRFGFAPAGRLSGVGRKHGRWMDTVLMQRQLGTAR